MDIIYLDDDLRLIKPPKKDWKYALKWYQDKDILYYSEGIPYNSSKKYDMNIINNMYSYLSKIGDLYFIQLLINNKWQYIGDAACSDKNMPIVIGNKNYWGKGIGKKVLLKLIKQAKTKKYNQINVDIYKYNVRSIKLYESCGFKKISEDNDKYYYCLFLT